MGKYSGILAEAVADEYGFTKEDVDRIRYIGLVHDIGKVGIPDAILNKPGKLNDEEFALMKQHAVIGYELLGTLKTVWMAFLMEFGIIMRDTTERDTRMGLQERRYHLLQE